MGGKMCAVPNVAMMSERLSACYKERSKECKMHTAIGRYGPETANSCYQNVLVDFCLQAQVDGAVTIYQLGLVDM